MRMKKRYAVIAIIFIIVVAFIGYSTSYHQKISTAKFIKHMEKNGFTVEDMLTDKEGNPIHTDEDYLNTHIRASSYSGKVQIDFKVYDTIDDARDVYVKATQNKKFQASNIDPKSFDIAEKEGLRKPSTASSGANYDRNYTYDLGGNYSIISRIDNTFLTAQVNVDDKNFTNDVLADIGY